MALKRPEISFICLIVVTLVVIPGCVQTSRMDGLIYSTEKNLSRNNTTPQMDRSIEQLSEIEIVPKLGLTGMAVLISDPNTGFDLYRGVQVVKVLENGPADKAGIKSGDLIFSVALLPGVKILGGDRITHTVETINRNLDAYQKGDLTYIRVKSLSKRGDHWYEQHFSVVIEDSDNTQVTAENYVEKPRTVTTGLFYNPHSRRNDSDPVYNTWYANFLKSERYKKLIQGDAYGQQEKISLKDGYVDLSSMTSISSTGGGQFELYTNKTRCHGMHDEVNLFIIASSTDNYVNHRINLGSIIQTAKKYCNYENKANIFFVEKNGKIREKFSILKGSNYIYKSPVNSQSVPDLVKKGTYGPLLYNLSSGGSSAIIDRKSMVITRYIYNSFGFSFGKHCKSVYGVPDIVRSTTIASNQYGITGSSERSIEVAPGFAKGIERYQGRVTGMTSLWVFREVDNFIKTYGCRSESILNMSKALIEFEKADYIK